MEENDYLNLHSKFIQLIDSMSMEDVKQIDIQSRLDEIKLEKPKRLKEFYIRNSTKQTIRTYIQSLSNQLNLYPIRILKLKAWNKLFEKSETKVERLFIHQDRIIPSSTLLLIEPNVIKNRIAFFFLSSIEEKFKLSDINNRYSVSQLGENSYKSEARKKYDYDLSKINQLLKNINTDKIKKFRDNYTHKIAPNIGLGSWAEFKTTNKDGMSAVSHHMIHPIGVNEVIELAESETNNLFLAFDELFNFLKQVANYT